MKHYVKQTRKHAEIVLALALVVLATAVALPSAQPVAAANASSTAAAAALSCAPHVTRGALGREGGLTALRGPADQAAPVTRIVQGDSYALYSARMAPGGVSVVYTRTGCLGQEGGLLSPGNR